MKKVVIFARVSTNIQDYERQVNELTAVAHNNNWMVAATFCEKISGAKRNTERKELTKLIDYVRTNNINIVLVTELSRLGRDTLQVLEVIEQFNKLGISLLKVVTRIIGQMVERLVEKKDIEKAILT